MATTTLSTESAHRVGLFRFAVFNALFVLLHIKGGAMVTSTGSGMAFTDWPLARGSLWPPGMDLEDYFEHIHRASGATVGLLGIVLTIWVFRADGRRWLGWVSFGLLAMIVVQGVFGGLGVIYGAAGGTTWAPAAIVHGVFAQPTLCVAAFVALALSRDWSRQVAAPAEEVATARKLATIAVVLVFTQIAVGAVVRHTNQQGMLWLHVFLALVVAVAIFVAGLYAQSRFKAAPGFAAIGKWIGILLLAQLMLGFVTLGVRRVKDPSNIEYLGRSLVVSGHVVVGACLFLLATLLLVKTWRNLQPVR